MNKELTQDTIVEHKLEGVTPEMLDWWWDNMEKGYALWCPEEHKGFTWSIPPSSNGHIGALQIAVESINFSPVMPRPIRWADPKELLEFPIQMEHVLAAGFTGSGRFLSHQYEKTSYGTFLRSMIHVPVPGPRLDDWARHNELESSYFPIFLPELYNLWKYVEDPVTNVPCCLIYPYCDINKPR